MASNVSFFTRAVVLVSDGVPSRARRSTGMPGYACAMAMGDRLSSCAGTREVPCEVDGALWGEERPGVVDRAPNRLTVRCVADAVQGGRQSVGEDAGRPLGGRPL